MENVLIILSIYLVTINTGISGISAGNDEQIKIDSLSSNSATYKHLDDLDELREINVKKRIKRKSHDFNPNRMHYPDEFLPFTKISAKNCSFGLCEKVENYPSERIEKIVSRSLDIQKYFAEQPPNVDIISRFGEDGENLCSTRVHTLFPQSATNIHGVEQILVNVGEYKQGVNFETCVNAEKPCRFSEVFPDGYTTICQQKFTVRRMMAVGTESDRPLFDNFQMPSCCVCTIKKT